MMTLIAAAALGAAQPAPMPAAMQHEHATSMNHEQHQAMEGQCCCEQMGDMHEMHAPESRPHDRNQ